MEVGQRARNAAISEFKITNKSSELGVGVTEQELEEDCEGA